MSDLPLYESLAILKHKHKLSPSVFKLLSEWLGVYTYILPADRTLNESALCIPPRDSYWEAFRSVWELMTILETNYTSEQQSKIIRHIQCTPHHKL